MGSRALLNNWPIAGPSRQIPPTPDAGVAVPAGYTRSYYGAAPLFYTLIDGLNTTGGQPVFDDGQNLVVAA